MANTLGVAGLPGPLRSLPYARVLREAPLVALDAPAVATQALVSNSNIVTFANQPLPEHILKHQQV